MHITVIHHGRKWRRVENHMRCAACPECGATIHDSEGHRARKLHERHHEQLAAILHVLAGEAEASPREPIPWTAAVGETDDQEALEGA